MSAGRSAHVLSCTPNIAQHAASSTSTTATLHRPHGTGIRQIRHQTINLSTTWHKNNANADADIGWRRRFELCSTIGILLECDDERGRWMQ